MSRKHWSILLLLITGCNLFPLEDPRYLPKHQDTEVLMDYSYVSNTSTSITYDVNISVLPSLTNDNDLTFFLPDEFHVEGEGTFDTTFTFETYEASGSAATVFLMDQSGSFTEIDPYNNRTKGVNKFLEDFTSDFMMGGFSEAGSLSQEPVEYSQNDFATTWNNQPFLFELASRTGGSNNAYDAIDHALDKLIGSSATRKNLVILLHSSDQASAVTTTSLITKANANNIHINVLLFGPETETQPSEIWELTEQTNGLLANCPSDADLITVFDHLHRLLNESYTVYKIRVTFTPTSGSVASGNVFENSIQLIDKYSGYEFNPLYIKVNVP